MKLFQPVFYLTLFLLPLEKYQAVIYIDSVVDYQAEVSLGFLEKVRCDHVIQEI